MTGHDPDESGDEPLETGDDADGTPAEGEDRPDGWPDDWTTADEDARPPEPDEDARPPESVEDARPSDSSDDPAEDEALTENEEGAGQRDGNEPDDGVDGGTGPATASDDGPAIESDGSASELEDGSIAASTNDPVSGTAADADSDGRTADSTLGEPTSPEKPPAPNVDESGPTVADDGFLTWFMNTNNAVVVVVRDVVSSVAAVAAVGLVLFAISGIWPPLVAVESGSMEPHMSKGDLVFLVDENRFVPQSAIEDTGVSTYRSASDANGYSKFGNYGDVVVYKPYGDDRRTPIIHRARFHVEEGENWVDDANSDYLGGVDSCAEVPRNMCPAPYDGFITKGDANPTYDQIGDQSNIVKDDWVRGKAEVRIPLLGWIRLEFAKLATAGPTQIGTLSSFGSFGEFAARLTALGFAGAATLVFTRI